jgi:hypothetical protein
VQEPDFAVTLISVGLGFLSLDLAVVGCALVLLVQRKRMRRNLQTMSLFALLFGRFVGSGCDVLCCVGRC